MNARLLPPSVRVIERGYLNCNQVVLLERGDNVLVDTGYCTHREQTLELLAGPAGLDGQPLERIINTHCHADHVGGNAAVASVYGCTITVPAGEVKHLVPWTAQSVWMERFDQRADPFRFDDTIDGGDAFAAGGFEWEVHAAPGHDMDALVFFEPRHRILISGDALWDGAMGFVWPEEGANPFIESALETLELIERLDPAVVIPGHGPVFFDAAGSIATVRSRLAAFAADPAKAARHALKVVFVFALLERGAMAVAEIPAYVGRVALYRELSERFLGLDAAALAEWLVGELLRAGAVRIHDGRIVPVAKA